MLQTIQDFVTSLPAHWQWLGVMLVSAVPFVESYLGAAIGVVTGVPVALAVAAAVVGNVVSMWIFVTLAQAVRPQRSPAGEAPPLSPRRQRIQRLLARYGVPGVSLIGQTVLPSQLTAATMVALGAERRQVVFWQVLSITLWGVLFGVLAVQGAGFLT